MVKKSKTKFIAETAIFIALLVVVQYATASFGQYVTGSAVNFILIASCLLSGWKSSVIIAILSPFVARLFGIGPAFIQRVPVISLGNFVLVLMYGAIFGIKLNINTYVRWIASIVFGAMGKFLTLFLIIPNVVIPFLNVQAQAAAKLTAMFGLSQFITAFIGGALAMMVVPLIKRAKR